MTHYSNDPAICREVHRLLRQGWTLADRRGRHLCILTPGGHRIAIPGTPSDRRAVTNWLQRIRRIEAGREQFSGITIT